MRIDRTDLRLSPAVGWVVLQGVSKSVLGNLDGAFKGHVLQRGVNLS